MKKLLFVILSFVGLNSFAQTNSFKYIQLQNVDTTAFTLKPGQIWYNPTVNKFSLNENGVIKHINSSTVTSFQTLTDGPGSFSGKMLDFTRVNIGSTALEYRTPSQVLSDIGAQSTISFGTGVQTALGVNIGSAGAPVLFNAAGGTPSSLVGTNITGTALGLTAGKVITNLTYPIGLVFTDDFIRANGTPGANYTVTTTTGTIAIVSNLLNMVGPAGGGFGNYCTYNGYVSASKNGECSITYTQTGAISTTSFGPFLYFNSTSGLNATSYQVLLTSTTANNGLIDVYRNGVRVSVQASASGCTIAQNDVVTLSAQLTEFGVTVSVRNVTSGKENNFTVDMGHLTSQTTVNVFKYAVGSVGGTQDVQSFAVNEKALINPNICVVGNSIAQGYGSQMISSGWVNLIQSGSSKKLTNLTIQSGRTSEFLQIVTQMLLVNADIYVLCELMGNDISTGVSSGTWQANYASIVSSLTGAGKTVYHVSTIPRNATDQSGGLTYLNANYQSTTVDVYTPLVGSGTNINRIYGDGGGTHPNDNGHAKIANLVSIGIPALFR